MRLTSAVALAALASAAASQVTLDCPLRQLALDYAMKQQPFRPLAAFQEVADALNGAQEAQNCSVAPNAALLTSQSSRRVQSFALPKSGLVVYVDPSDAGSDVRGDGTVGKPLSTLAKALSVIRFARASAKVKAADAPQATIVLRGGTFHLSETLQLTAEDSRVNFQAYPGEAVEISGAVPLPASATWTSVTPPARDLYEYRAGQLGPGFDLAIGQYTVADAQTWCTANPLCLGFTYNSGSAAPSGAVTVNFKYNIFYARASGYSTYVKNVGYLPNAANLWSTKLDLAEFPEIDALRVNGLRGIRARYPNVPTAELLGAMQIVADHWAPQPQGTNANYTFNPPTPFRNDTIPNGANGNQPYFASFKLGVGGPCAERFTPQAGYWCSDNSEGGGPGPYQAPVGMTVSNANESLPHTPYQYDVSRAVVHSWRAGRWYSWAFGVENATFNSQTGQTTFAFNRGGNQGSRGGNAGQEMFIENVRDELDAPGEFFYDNSDGTLYLWYNATAGTPPPAGSVTIPQLTVLINATGTQAQPVVDVGFLGITFRDSAPNFMGPHGTPSGGDWAVERSGALFFEGTVGVLLQGNLLTRLDGNAVFFSGYTRNATVSSNEFAWIGETCVTQWGYTDGSPVPGMGFDATAGNQPRGTFIHANLGREVGVWTKQNSFYFQAESFGNVLSNNIAYNGPRAGLNLNDGMGGGSVISENVLFNFCRESSDHGPINSWDRQVYQWDDENGQVTIYKKNDTIANNFIIANYHSSMAVDNDDGSAFFDTHDNVFFYAALGAAYGGNSLKSDFGGHSNFHHGNLDLFFGKGFGINGQLAGFEDGYYDNILYMTQDGNYGSGQTCTGASATVVHNNTIYSPTGAISECGMNLTAWQSQGNDPNTKALPYPDDSVILGLVHTILGF